MKIKSGFITHSIGDETVVVPVGERTTDFHGLIRLNKTGAFLFENMKEAFTRESLVLALLDRYDTDKATAEASVDKFISELSAGGILEE